MSYPAKQHKNYVWATLAIIPLLAVVIGCSGGSPPKPVHNAITDNPPLPSPPTIEPVPAADTPVRIEPAPDPPRADPR